MYAIKLWCYAKVRVDLSAKLPTKIPSCVTLLLVLMVPAPAASGSTKGWLITMQPRLPVNGSPLLFRIKPPKAVEQLSGKWLGHEIPFNFDPATKTWFGFAGVSLETRPGSYTFQVSATRKNGDPISFGRPVTIGKAKYKRISVSVSKKFTEPSADQLRTISEDKQTKEALFNRVTPEREWSGNFRAPVRAPVSDVFGTERVFNGKVQSYHQGLDYGVPSGTPVSALNSGTVILARNLYFEGNCVVIDHGQGLLSLYLHLSEFAVKEGQRLKRGELIGLSGGTGRATGPHLHVAVRWQGVYLNPATLLSLTLPADLTP